MRLILDLCLDCENTGQSPTPARLLWLSRPRLDVATLSPDRGAAVRLVLDSALVNE